MTAEEIQSQAAPVDGAPAPEPAPALPDYVLDENAVLKDVIDSWRHGRAPDYSRTRKVYAESLSTPFTVYPPLLSASIDNHTAKKASHTAGSLPDLVEKLVKNWEIEASYKTSLSDWRTIDVSSYTFSVNGGPPQSGEHMLQVGTYNAIIEPNEFYCPFHSSFDGSHKTFKRMMPTFAWEVLEVFSGPPTVTFRWRHWGTMKEDYVGTNK